MVREARFQLALAPHGPRLPTIRAVCEDESVIGVPFYVMDFIEGHVLTTTLPAGLETEAARRRLGLDFVDALVEIHAVDVNAPGVAEFIRPGSYLERQVRRFSQLWEVNRTREIPAVVEVGSWLAENLPEPLPLAVVHGDYRLGNTIVSSADPAQIEAVLDWEMGAVGDPRADVGYLLATYSEPGGAPNPLGTSAVTATARVPVEERARRALRRAKRPRGRAARLVPGARALEGGGLLRGDLRAVHPRRARQRGRLRSPLRDGRAAARETALELIA